MTSVLFLCQRNENETIIVMVKMVFPKSLSVTFMLFGADVNAPHVFVWYFALMLMLRTLIVVCYLVLVLMLRTLIVVCYLVTVLMLHTVLSVIWCWC